MDEQDRIIVEILRRDGRGRNADIARALGVSEGTVRRRLRRLIDEGYIYVVAIPNPRMMGSEIEALIGVRAEPSKIDAVADALAAMDETAWVSVSTGPYDIYGWVALASPEALGAFLRTKVSAIDGVQRTESFVSLSVKKRHYGECMNQVKN